MPITTDILKQFDFDVFVETGTRWGAGVLSALSAGAKVVHSIEFDAMLYLFCSRRFAKSAQVRLYYGDSGELLGVPLQLFNKPGLIWLDAHPIEGTITTHNTPILRELDVLRLHHVTTHTLLIDDWQFFNDPARSEISYAQIEDKIAAINPRYKYSTIDGPESTIMVAQINPVATVVI